MPGAMSTTNEACTLGFSGLNLLGNINVDSLTLCPACSCLPIHVTHLCIFRSQADSRTATALKDAMRERCLTELLRACYQLTLALHAQQPQLAAGVLQATARYVSWIDISLVANDQCAHVATCIVCKAKAASHAAFLLLCSASSVQVALGPCMSVSMHAYLVLTIFGVIISMDAHRLLSDAHQSVQDWWCRS